MQNKRNFLHKNCNILPCVSGKKYKQCNRLFNLINRKNNDQETEEDGLHNEQIILINP